MPWYQLPASFQRQLCCAIHSIQNGPVLSIGPLAQLDFNRAADVSFKSYSESNRSNTGLFFLFQLTKQIYRFTMLLFTAFE